MPPWPASASSSPSDSFAFIEALLSAKGRLARHIGDIHDLVNFYKTQITAWRKLLARSPASLQTTAKP